MPKSATAKSRDHKILPIAVSGGEPSGIGPDIILDAWIKRQAHNLPPFYVLGDIQQLNARASMLGYDIQFAEATPLNTVEIFDTALPVIQLENKLTESVGKPLVDNAVGVIEAIDRAVRDVVAGEATSLVTAPIAKKPLYDSGFRHPGHTEYLAALANRYSRKTLRPVMMIAGPNLRTIPVTIHIPLADVATTLTRDLIIETVQIADHDLKKRFGLNSPRIAIAGLNPHAGENGAMGHQDIDIIVPALNALKAQNINAFGPLPADTMFHARARQNYDVAVCMYHDQALIPVKALDFDEGVNVTLGLPFIRTSPDHGTAFDIAGKGIARADSFIAALKMADQMAKAASDV